MEWNWEWEKEHAKNTWTPEFWVEQRMDLGAWDGGRMGKQNVDVKRAVKICYVGDAALI